MRAPAGAGTVAALQGDAHGAVAVGAIEGAVEPVPAGRRLCRQVTHGAAGAGRGPAPAQLHVVAHAADGADGDPPVAAAALERWHRAELADLVGGDLAAAAGRRYVGCWRIRRPSCRWTGFQATVA